MRVRVALGKIMRHGRRRHPSRSTLKNTMNITTSHTRYILTSMLALATAACGGDPCIPTIIADTSIIAAADDCISEDSTPGDESSSGSMCPMPVEVDAPTCVTSPQAGEAWGRCFVTMDCNDGLDCRVTGAGGVCVPPCGECGCPADFGCFGGVCEATDACVPQCEAGDVCPGVGMHCDSIAGICIYPEFAPVP